MSSALQRLVVPWPPNCFARPAIGTNLLGHGLTLFEALGKDAEREGLYLGDGVRFGRARILRSGSEW